MGEGGCATCRELLAEGLDLCVRARDLDAIDRRHAAICASCDPHEWQESGNFDRYVTRHNIEWPDKKISTRSGTVPLWLLQDQYDKDLAAWEQKGRQHLMQGCSATPSPSQGKG